MTDQSAPSTRAQQQRTRILCAAQSCFVKYGFHAATMAQIAEAAEMSAGLIYRYFSSKNTIILAIIEQQLVMARESIQQLRTVDTLTSGLLEMFRLWQQRDDSAMSVALFMEMSAEASREEDVAAALQESDRELRADFAAWLMRPVSAGGAGMGAARAGHNAFILQCFTNGLALRALRESDLGEPQVREAINHFVDGLLADQRVI